jgi:DNA-binding transcriptional ArsR family regulator
LEVHVKASVVTTGVHTGIQGVELAPDEATRLADLFRMLGDPGRTRILFALLDAGELCVSDLAVAVHAPETSVSHALRLLRTAGIVRNRRDGRNVYYALDDAHVRMLLALSLEHLRHGDEVEGRP